MQLGTGRVHGVGINSEQMQRALATPVIMRRALKSPAYSKKFAEWHKLYTATLAEKAPAELPVPEPDWHESERQRRRCGQVVVPALGKQPRLSAVDNARLDHLEQDGRRREVKTCIP
eukprot:2359443-Rhodomonas_salina.1